MIGVGRAIMPSRKAEVARHAFVAALMGSRILVVDDDLLVSMFTAEMLEDLGYEPCEAGSAREAMEMVRGDADIAMVLTDLHMPQTDGRQLAREARAVRPNLPVILVTGDAFAEGDGRGLPVLGKPYTSQQLDGALRQAGMAPRCA